MLEIPAERIPPAKGERVRLWREELLHRRAVIILDDVSSPEQILPVVPMGGDCLIIIASRRRRADWLPHQLLTLLPLTADEAVTLMTRIIGPGADREPGQVAKAARLCGRLPLAIRVAAGRLRNRQLSGLGELLDELADLSSGQRNVSETGRQITSAFEFSYRQLTGGQQRFFRYLGICPCSDITLETATALTGSTPDAAESYLRMLLEHHLLEHISADRFRFHNIIRAYAASCCTQDDPESERRQAISRLIDHYMLALDRVNRVLFAPPRAPAETESGIARHEAEVNNIEVARMWLEAERHNILLIARYAGGHEWKQQCADLTHAFAQFLETSGYWSDALAAHNVALHACDDLEDLPRTARAAFDLSFTSLRTGHHAVAEEHAVRAMTIYRSLGDRRGEAAALDRLGLVCRNSSRLRDALAHHQEAIDIYRGIGDVHGLADSLVHAGSAYGTLGRYAEEINCLYQALDLYRYTGNRRGEAITLNNLGAVHDDRGRHRDAMENYQKSLAIFRQISGRQNLALLDHNMGRVLQYKGRFEDAIVIYRGVLKTYRAIGDLQHQAMALDDIGCAFGFMESYSESLVHHQKAAALAKDIGDLCLHAFAVCGIADAYRGSGSYFAALEHYGKAGSLAGEIESPYLKAKALYGMAETVLRTRGHEAARIYWREALDIFGQLGVPEAATVELRLHGLSTSAS
jgi:tetratricopeptide (TPR) repeat protein